MFDIVVFTSLTLICYYIYQNLDITSLKQRLASESKRLLISKGLPYLDKLVGNGTGSSLSLLVGLLKKSDAPSAVIHCVEDENAGVISEYISIPYKYKGVEYTIHLPYSRDNLVNIGKKVYLVNKDGNKKEITHQPGMSYYLTAEKMGGERIYCYDALNDDDDSNGGIADFGHMMVPVL